MQQIIIRAPLFASLSLSLSVRTLVKSTQTLFFPNGRNGIAITGILSLSGGPINQELHAGTDHPDGIGECITDHARQESGNEGIGR
jgi:hypothetical protein